MCRMGRIAALILLVVLPNFAQAQDARFERIREAFPAQAVSQIEVVLADAQAAGVPTEPLVAKVLEGAAKGVPAERVVAALSAYAERLGEAHALVGEDRDPGAVVAGADALRRGVPAEAVRSLAGHGAGELAVPLVVLGDLMEAGVPVDYAYEVVQRARDQQHDPDEMLAIPGAVRRMMREGQTPAEAADLVGKAIGRGKFKDFLSPQDQPTASPPSGPPVPPGAGPPDHAGPKKDKGKGKPPGE